MVAIGALLLVIGVAVGYLTGGRLSRLASIEVPSPALGAAALAVPIAAGLAFGGTDSAGSRVALIGGLGLGGAWVAGAIRRQRGWAVRSAFALTGLGWASNTLVIAANGRMPVAASYTRDHVLERARHLVIGPSTHLRVLADVIPFRGTLLSIGDALMVFGIVAVVATGMSRGARAGLAPAIGSALGGSELADSRTTRVTKATDGP